MKTRLAAAATTLALLIAAPSYAAPTDSEVQSIAAARVEYISAKKAIDREDWDAAYKCLKSAERLDPHSADIQNLLGFTLRQKGEVDPAIRHYGRALELNPYHRGAHEYLGRLYLHMGKPEKAQALLAKLEAMCTERCPERDSLKLAISEWDPWKGPVRGARGY